MAHPSAPEITATPLPEAVQEMQSHQMLSSAVHQTLEALLPDAAVRVERATCDVTDELVELSTLVTAQQDLLRMALMQSAIPSDEVGAIEAQGEALCAKIQKSISAMIMGLQFQDRNSQLMQSAVQMIKHCNANVAAPVVAPTMAARLSSVSRARHILTSVTIHEVREMLISAFENARVLPRKSKAAKNEPDHSVELF